MTDPITVQVTPIDEELADPPKSLKENTASSSYMFKVGVVVLAVLAIGGIAAGIAVAVSGDSGSSSTTDTDSAPLEAPSDAASPTTKEDGKIPKINFGLMHITHSFTNGILSYYSTEVFTDARTAAPFPETHAIMMSAPIARAQIHNSNYEQRVRSLARQVYDKQWDVTVMHMLANEFVGNYTSGVHLWAGPRDDQPEPQGPFVSVVRGMDTILDELYKLCGDSDRYTFTHGATAGYFHGHYRLRMYKGAHDESSGMPNLGKDDDDLFWTNPMSSVILIDTKAIKSIGADSEGWNTMGHYEDMGVELPWWMEQNRQLAMPMYAGGTPYAKETLYDLSHVLGKLEHKETGFIFAVGIAGLPGLGLVEGLATFHELLNQRAVDAGAPEGTSMLEGYSKVYPYDTDLKSLTTSLKVQDKFHGILNRVKDQVGELPTVLLVISDTQVASEEALSSTASPHGYTIGAVSPNAAGNSTHHGYYRGLDELATNPWTVASQHEHQIRSVQQVFSKGFGENISPLTYSAPRHFPTSEAVVSNPWGYEGAYSATSTMVDVYDNALPSAALQLTTFMQSPTAAPSPTPAPTSSPTAAPAPTSSPTAPGFDESMYVWTADGWDITVAGSGMQATFLEALGYGTEHAEGDAFTAEQLGVTALGFGGDEEAALQSMLAGGIITETETAEAADGAAQYVWTANGWDITVAGSGMEAPILEALGYGTEHAEGDAFTAEQLRVTAMGFGGNEEAALQSMLAGGIITETETAEAADGTAQYVWTADGWDITVAGSGMEATILEALGYGTAHAEGDAFTAEQLRVTALGFGGDEEAALQSMLAGGIIANPP